MTHSIYNILILTISNFLCLYLLWHKGKEAKFWKNRSDYWYESYKELMDHYIREEANERFEQMFGKRCEN